jgi:hypothetical protein
MSSNGRIALSDLLCNNKTELREWIIILNNFEFHTDLCKIIDKGLQCLNFCNLLKELIFHWYEFH